MRLNLLFLFGLLIIGSPLFSQSGWLPQQSNTTNSLKGIYFFDKFNGIAIGNKGTIITTEDGGKTWIVIDAVTQSHLQDIFFVNRNIGWICGQNGLILKSVDGGKTWEPQATNVTNWLYSIYFFNEYIGFAVGDGGIILKTTDGGTTWSKTQAATSYLYCVSFLNDSVGIIVGYQGFLAITRDTGKVWEKVELNLDDALLKCFFKKDKCWVITNKGKILTSVEPFTIWQTNQVTEDNDALMDLFFPTDSIGWGVTWSGKILKTTNLGLNWSTQFKTTFKLFKVFFVDEYYGWVVGENGAIYFTNTGGEEPSIVDDPSLFIFDYFDLRFFPISKTLHLRFKVSKSSNVKINLFDFSCRIICNIASGQFNSNVVNEIDFDASFLLNGIYFLSFDTMNHAKIDKIMIY